MRRICIIGCGSIGSLYAAHLARIAEVHVFVRRPEHAARLNAKGLQVSGKHDFTAAVHASAVAAEIPSCDLGILCTKATEVAAAIAPLALHFEHGAIISAQNGLGVEEIVAQRAHGWVIRGTTFMSGTRLDDRRVEYELDAPTWLGPYEVMGTPMALVRDAAEAIASSGLKAVALEDARPAQWSKTIFNAAVNTVAALTELPHCAAFAAEQEFEDLGHLVHELIAEGERVAAEAGVRLSENPWDMNCIGAQTDHPPSMLYDLRHHLPTEVEFLAGAIARAARDAGVPAPLHTAMYRLIRGREASWRRVTPAAVSGPQQKANA